MSLFERLRAGLARTRELTVGRIAYVLGRGKVDSETLALLEEILILADVGAAATGELIEAIKRRQSELNALSECSLEELLSGELRRMLDPPLLPPYAVGGETDLPPYVSRGEKKGGRPRFTAKPWVVLLVGVNGSGKTTTAGKLAHIFAAEGKRSVIAAADTFRAAATLQLEEWARRSGARFVRQEAGADPAAVAFDAYKSALARGDDVLIVDTAGRLQAKKNLMDELAKVKRVLGRLDPGAPHEVLLVIDATTGQNGLSQARGFDAAAGVTGLVVTKLDGTARGGIIVPIRREVGLPVQFIGMGEGIEDLQPFNPGAYVRALLSS